MSTIRTIILPIIKCSDKSLLEQECANYTGAYKKGINHAELLADDDYMEYICSEYHIETYQAYRNLVKDIKGSIDSATECFKLREKRLDDLYLLLEEETDKTKRAKTWKSIQKTEKSLEYDTIKTKNGEKKVPKISITFGTHAKKAKLTKAVNKLNRLINKKANPEKYSVHKNKTENQTHYTYFDKKLNKKVKVKKEPIKETIDQQIENQKKLVEKYKKDLKESAKYIGIFCEGEANQQGNRYVKFDNMSSQHMLTYCPTANKHIDLNFICNKNTHKLLCKLEKMALEEKIPLTVRLVPDYIYISYDEEVLNGYAFDKNSYKKERNNELAKESAVKCRELTEEEKEKITSEIKKKYAIEREERQKKGKIVNRIAATDLNPDNAVLVIFDILNNGEIRFIRGYHYDFSFYTRNKWRYSSTELNSHINNKHISEIHLVYKDMFKKCNHYKCFIFGMEDLDLTVPKAVDPQFTTEFRRLVNNIWHRELHTYDVQKWCAIYGLKIIKVAPWYTSWIGNIKNNYIDPVNAAIEIGRRAYYKFKQEGQYPYPVMTDDDYGKLVDLFPEFFKNESVVRKYNLRRNWPYWFKTLTKLFSDGVEFGYRYRAGFKDIPGDRYESGKLNLYNSRVILSVF